MERIAKRPRSDSPPEDLLRSSQELTDFISKLDLPHVDMPRSLAITDDSHSDEDAACLTDRLKSILHQRKSLQSSGRSLAAYYSKAFKKCQRNII